MRVSLPSRRESIWSPSADGERRQGCAQHCEHAGTKEPLAVSFISSWEQGKVKVGCPQCQSPTAAIRGSIPNSPNSHPHCRDADHTQEAWKITLLLSQAQTTGTKDCSNTHTQKKKLISCCCTSTLHQLSVIHTLLFEFRPYKWGNTLRVTCQVSPADDLWTDLL